MDRLIRALTEIVDEYRSRERQEAPTDYDKGYLSGLGAAAEVAARALGIDLLPLGN